MPSGTLNAPTIQIPDAKDPYQVQNATAQQSTAVGYDPSKFTVAKNQTVAGQLDSLIDKDSAYMQQAQRRAMQGMNDRGLLNSSIAVGAGEDAAIGAALPIATSDAGTFNQANINTINAENAAKNFKAGAENTSSLANAQLGTDVSKTNAGALNTSRQTAYQAGTQLQLAGVDANTRLATAQMDTNTRLELGHLDADTRLALGQLDANTRLQINQVDNQYRGLLQTNQSATNLQNQVMQNIANISQSTTLDQAGKDNAIQSQLNMLQQSLAAIQNTNPADAQALAHLNLGSFWQGGTTATGGGAPTGSPVLPAPAASAPATDEGHFDAQRYLTENPDVAQAVAAGQIPSAWFHYLHYGQNEGRKAYAPAGNGAVSPAAPAVSFRNDDLYNPGRAQY